MSHGGSVSGMCRAFLTSRWFSQFLCAVLFIQGGTTPSDMVDLTLPVNYRKETVTAEAVDSVHVQLELVTGPLEEKKQTEN